jgi:hypothetical protein
MAIRQVAMGLFAALAVVQPSWSEAEAGFTVYTSASDYAAASTGNTTVNFNGLAPSGGFTPEPVPPGLTVGGVNFTIDQSTSNGLLFVINQLGPHYGPAPVVSSQGSTSGVDNLVVTLPGASTAFAFDGNSFINSSGSFGANPLTVTLSNGDSFTFTHPPDGTYGFIGVTDTTAFTSITITDSTNGGGGTMNLADVSFGAAVPEPSSLALLAIGVAGVVGLRMRRDRRKSDR